MGYTENLYKNPYALMETYDFVRGNKTNLSLRKEREVQSRLVHSAQYEKIKRDFNFDIGNFCWLFYL